MKATTVDTLPMNESAAQERPSVQTNNRQRLALIKPYIGRSAIGFAVMVVTIVIQLNFPKAIAYFIDNTVEKTDSSWLTSASLVMLKC
jgi:hypothetical protein